MTMVLPKRGEKGFTLIELMIVIAIIGILAAIAIPQFASYRKRAADSAALSDARNLATAQEVYYGDKFKYTAATADLANAGFRGFSNNVSISGTPTASTTTYTMIVVHSGGEKKYAVSPAGVAETN